MTEATARMQRFFAERSVHVETQTFDASVHTAQFATLCAVQQARQARAERTRSVTGYRIGEVPPDSTCHDIAAPR